MLDPNYGFLKVDAYPDADFSGMYGHINPDATACAKRCIGFNIISDVCPVLWISKLQTETAPSTMEEEIISLYHCCRWMFHIIGITKSLGKAVGLPVGVPSIEVPDHKDNAGAIILAYTFPPKFMPRDKYYATKKVWFLSRSIKGRLCC